MISKLKLKKGLLALFVVPVFALGFLSAPAFAVGADSLTIGDGANSAQGNGQTSCIFGTEANCPSGVTPLFKVITNVLLFIIGAVSVVMLIIGGFRYTVSQGDSQALTSAKNTILYSIIGIIVALLAYGVVNFVISNFAAS